MITVKSHKRKTKNSVTVVREHARRKSAWHVRWRNKTTKSNLLRSAVTKAIRSAGLTKTVSPLKRLGLFYRSLRRR